MDAVVIIFKISFCAVPLFIRVDPVSGSAPVIASIGYFAILAISELVLVVIQHVVHPILFAYSRPPTTYGVLPLAAIPITTSFLFKWCFSRSNTAAAFE